MMPSVGFPGYDTGYTAYPNAAETAGPGSSDPSQNYTYSYGNNQGYYQGFQSYEGMGSQSTDQAANGQYYG